MKPGTFYTLTVLIVLIRIAVYSVIGSIIGIIIVRVCKLFIGA